MQRYKLIAVMGFIVATLGFRVSTAVAQESQERIAQQNSDFVDTLTRILDADKLHAVLIQHRACAGNEEQIPLMRNAAIHINKSAKSVADLFSVDPSWHVERRAGGLLLIHRGIVGDLVETKLNGLRLEPRERFDPDLALDRAMQQPEFVMEAHRLNAKSVIRFGGLVAPIQNGAKQLPDVLPSMTMEDFLIEETRTFGGLAIYNECKIGSHHIRFDMQVFPGNWSN